MAIKSRAELMPELLEVMKSAFCIMKASFHHAGHEPDLTSAEMRILFHIAHVQEGMSIKELAASINVSSSAATQFIDKLVEKKLVDRQYDQTDRRGVRIYLSKKTSHSFQELKKQYFNKLQPLFADFSNPELDQLITLLNKIKPPAN